MSAGAQIRSRLPAAALAACGAYQIALGIYFILLRPSLLPEDLRFLGSSEVAIGAAAPAFETWLDWVFMVMGGQMAGVGTLLLLLAGSLRRRTIAQAFEVEHDVRITQWLILQPRLELDLALQDIPEARVGAGLTTGSLGARLRYQVTPLFGPYVGVEYDRAFGETRDRRTVTNEDVGGVSLVAGVRAWF